MTGKWKAKIPIYMTDRYRPIKKANIERLERAFGPL